MPRKIVCVIGPGAAKECERIAQQYRLVHIEITGAEGADAKVEFLTSAMSNSSGKNFVIEDFPRSLEEYLELEKKTGVSPEFIIYLDGTALEAPLLHHCESRGLLRRINPSNCSTELQNMMFSPLIENELLELSAELLRAIDDGDYATYQKICDDGLTAFEPESQGQLVEGLPFHKFYFDVRETGKFLQRVSTIAAPKVMLVSDTVALVTYTRLLQAVGTPLAGYVDAHNETRLWKLSVGERHSQWKHVHFHRSRAPTVPEFYKVTI